MKPIVILMRHAKSSWADSSMTDFERPLNNRGQSAAPLMARFLRQKAWIPNQIVSSSSVRTRETLDRMLPEWNSKPKVHFADDLYLAPPNLIQEAVFTAWQNDVDSLDEKGTPLLMLGHNPGMELFASSLAGQSLPMPTAAVAVFQWKKSSAPKHGSEISCENFELLQFVVPKELVE